MRITGECYNVFEYLENANFGWRIIVTGPMKRALNAAIEKGQNMRVVLTAWICN